ncbi:ribose import ATP-binding protein RbsA [Striga asiatica]|uniref:Ribose import ATP-binding protein RbsA n=1 Tax=Striga asiatica TaxID=4170 RepID=A0A5A7PSZ0_STRAF|nr:ribose import ATP-binding protein RbsA [Striga asiatica]
MRPVRGFTGEQNLQQRCLRPISAVHLWQRLCQRVHIVYARPHRNVAVRPEKQGIAPPLSPQHPLELQPGFSLAAGRRFDTVASKPLIISSSSRDSSFRASGPERRFPDPLGDFGAPELGIRRVEEHLKVREARGAGAVDEDLVDHTVAEAGDGPGFEIRQRGAEEAAVSGDPLFQDAEGDSDDDVVGGDGRPVREPDLHGPVLEADGRTGPPLDRVDPAAQLDHSGREGVGEGVDDAGVASGDGDLLPREHDSSLRRSSAEVNVLCIPSCIAKAARWRDLRLQFPTSPSSSPRPSAAHAYAQVAAAGGGGGAVLQHLVAADSGAAAGGRLSLDEIHEIFEEVGDGVDEGGAQDVAALGGGKGSVGGAIHTLPGLVGVKRVRLAGNIVDGAAVDAVDPGGALLDPVAAERRGTNPSANPVAAFNHRELEELPRFGEGVELAGRREPSDAGADYDDSWLFAHHFFNEIMQTDLTK